MKFKLLLVLSLFFLANMWTKFSPAQHIVIANEQPYKPIFCAVFPSLVDVDTKSVRLELFIVREEKVAEIAVAGKSEWKGDTLTFQPYYQLESNAEFEARLTTSRFSSAIRYSTPRKLEQLNAKSDSRVTHLYPLSGELPANILYFVAEFDQRMKADPNAFRYVHVFAPNGEEIPNLWRQRSYWLEDGKLLVLMVHPGRVKRGIKFPIPFEVGHEYSFVIDDSLKTISGGNLATPFEKKYVVVDHDYTTPEFSIVESLPTSGSNNALEFRFTEAICFAGVIDGLKIVNSEGRLIPGTFSTDSASESLVTFLPEEPWDEGGYEIVVDQVVCDYSGNRLFRLFETKDPNELLLEPESQTVQFQILR